MHLHPGEPVDGAPILFELYKKARKHIDTALQQSKAKEKKLGRAEGGHIGKPLLPSGLSTLGDAVRPGSSIISGRKEEGVAPKEDKTTGHTGYPLLPPGLSTLGDAGRPEGQERQGIAKGPEESPKPYQRVCDDCGDYMRLIAREDCPIRGCDARLHTNCVRPHVREVHGEELTLHFAL